MNFNNMAHAAKIVLPGKKDRKTGKQGVNWWFTFVFCRSAAMAAATITLTPPDTSRAYRLSIHGGASIEDPGAVLTPVEPQTEEKQADSDGDRLPMQVQAVLARRLAGPPTPIPVFRETVPPDLDALVQKAMARSAADRWQSAGDLAKALAAAERGGTPIRTHPPGPDAAPWLPPHPPAPPTTVACRYSGPGEQQAGVRTETAEWAARSCRPSTPADGCRDESSFPPGVAFGSPA